MTRKILKYIGILLFALLGLFLFIAFVLTIPKVQTSVTHQITNSLSETLQAKVRIQSVNIDFFKTAILKGIYIEDKKKNTLLFVDQLATDIGVLPYYKKIFF